MSKVVYDGDGSAMMREIDGKSNELMYGQGGAYVAWNSFF